MPTLKVNTFQMARFVLVITTLATMSWLIVIIKPIMLGTGFQSSTPPPPLFPVSLSTQGAAVAISLTSNRTSTENPSPELELSSIIFSGTESDKVSYCIRQFRVQHFVDVGEIPPDLPYLSEYVYAMNRFDWDIPTLSRESFETPCNIFSESDGVIWVPGSEEPKFTIAAEEVTPLYFFPFDVQRLNIGIRLTGVPYKAQSDSNGSFIADSSADEIQIAPYIIGNFQEDEWQPIVQHQEVITDYAGYGITRLTVEYSRPFSYRFFTIILLGAVAVFMLALFFIQELGTYLEIAFGIFLGLWGLQGVLVPSFVTWPNIVESSILTLYLELLVISVVRFVVKPLWDKLNPSGL